VSDNLGDFIQLEDGLVYFLPPRNLVFAAHNLRILADDLDRRNEKLNTQIEDYFNKKKEQ
jgi:hypothetical protein